MAAPKLQTTPPATSRDAAMAGALRDRRKDGQAVYLMLDGSKADGTRAILESLSDDALCMFDGQGFDDLADVAPWLVPLTLTDDDDVFDWFMETGYGRNAGILLIAGPDAQELKLSLKPGLWLKDENDEDLFFKFYRPSAFNTYMPGFEPGYVAHMLRAVDQVWAEDTADATLVHRYAVRNGTLAQADLRLLFDELRPPEAGS